MANFHPAPLKSVEILECWHLVSGNYPKNTRKLFNLTHGLAKWTIYPVKMCMFVCTHPWPNNGKQTDQPLKEATRGRVNGRLRAIDVTQSHQIIACD